VRIASVEAVPFAYPEPNDAGRTRVVCLVKLTTDDGVVGWGESVPYWPEAARAVKMIVDGVAQLVIGEDPVATEEIWRKLKAHTWWYGNGGIASMAIAAVDIALWDIKGKALGRRVLDLLGGPAKERLPAVASAHAWLPDLGALADQASGWVSTGLQGLKVGFGKRGDARLGYEHDRDVDYVRRVREAIGPGKLLMIDLGVAVTWDPETAIARVRAFEEHDLHWIEEPLGHWDPDGYRRLHDAVSTLVAYGEKEFGLEGIERVLRTGTCDVLGFDPGRAEGLTAFAQALRRVEAAGTQANAHAWSTAIVSAASLAVSWASPACRQFEVKPERDVAQFELVARPVKHEAGWMPQPEGAGLGIEVLEDVVDHYRLDR
jgi:L-alanine-DL-glutamate epimerase-like enolase superfamily enzyme